MQGQLYDVRIALYEHWRPSVLQCVTLPWRFNAIPTYRNCITNTRLTLVIDALLTLVIDALLTLVKDALLTLVIDGPEHLGVTLGEGWGAMVKLVQVFSAQLAPAQAF